MEKHFITPKILKRFKREQDDFNSITFLSLDENGIAKEEQLPQYIRDIVEIFVDNTDPENPKFYDSVERREITGEIGKLYIDMNSNEKYRWTGSNFTLFDRRASKIENAVYDINDNKIDEFYVKKEDILGGKNPIREIATNKKLGIVKIGNNFSVNSDGEISVSKSDVENALGFEPLSSENINEIQKENIENFFNSG